MPISFFSLAETSSTDWSKTMFMYWSNPRKTPTTFLFPLSLTAILISNFQAKRQNKDLELVKIKIIIW